jgi:hypothetical protein
MKHRTARNSPSGTRSVTKRRRIKDRDYYIPETKTYLTTYPRPGIRRVTPRRPTVRETLYDDRQQNPLLESQSTEEYNGSQSTQEYELESPRKGGRYRKNKQY